MRDDPTILNEFGYSLFDAESARLLFQTVLSCYERRGMTFATNIEFLKWGTILGDDKFASAMIDGIVHRGRMVKFSGESRRMNATLMLGKGEAWEMLARLPNCSN